MGSVAYTNLDNEIFANAALEAFVKSLAPLNAFSTNFSAAPGVRGGQVLVPIISSLSVCTFGASGYAICQGTMGVATVPLTQHKHVPVGQRDMDAANSSMASLEKFGRQQGAALAQAVIEDILSVVHTTNFSLCTAIVTNGMSVPDALRLGRKYLSQSNVPVDGRSFLLDTSYYDNLFDITTFMQANTYGSRSGIVEGVVPRAFGLDIYEINGSLTAVSTIGFFCHQAAVAVAMRYLEPQPGNTYLDARSFADPKTGIVLGLRDFYDNSMGNRYINLVANYGYTVGLSAAGRVLQSRFA